VKLTIPKIFQKNFSIKIFSFFAFFILIITFSFTAFFFRQESKSLTDALIQNNLLLADILAYSARIGVFSENEELLRNPVDGIFQQKETVEVSIFNVNGRLLKRQERYGKENVRAPDKTDKSGGQIAPGIIDKLKVAANPLYFENEDTIDFWSPVIASSGYGAAEDLFMENKSVPGKEHVIGFVQITVGKSALQKRLGALLMKSVLIGMIFLMAGAGIIYYAIKQIVTPLSALTQGIETLGRGGLGETVPVETEDEIGALAMAFNRMSESLANRETEKRQLANQLRHAQKMEAIGTLAGGIAHDFNNILGVIVGYAQTALLTNPGKAEMDRSLKEILQAGTRAGELIKQILTFSRQGSQERRPLLIRPIVEEALKMMRTTLPQNVEIRSNLKNGLAPVLSDAAQIHQVLMNLCTNAGHAMQDGGGVLEVNLDEVDMDAGDPELSIDMRPGNYQILTVSDTGQGVSSSVKERMFDPFFTTKVPGKGTGMGLSVVHGIVKMHGGKINCRSEPGKGTIFEVFFPTMEEASYDLPFQTP
jgi:signal transduction histidine kinase